MNDNADRQLEALFAAARADERDTSRIEFGFETRLAARLREESSASVFTWAWRLCPFFAALAIAAGLWIRVDSLRAQVDAEVLAGAAGAEDSLLAYMTGERR